MSARITSIVAWVLAIAALLIMQPAAARQGRAPERSTEEKARLSEFAMYQFSACMVQQSRKRSLAFLRLNPFSERFVEDGGDLVQDICVPPTARNIKFKPLVLRQSFYAVLYLREFPDWSKSVAANGGSLDYTKEVETNGEAVSNQFLNWRSFGDCVARVAPEAVHAYLVEFNFEKAAIAIAKVEPAINECRPTANGLTFSRPILRGVLAEAMYKLRVHAKGQAG